MERVGGSVSASSVSSSSLSATSPKGITDRNYRIERFPEVYYASLQSMVVPALLLPKQTYGFLAPANPVDSSASAAPQDPPSATSTPIPPLFQKIFMIFQDPSGSFDALELYLHKRGNIIARRKTFFPLFLSYCQYLISRGQKPSKKVSDRRLRVALENFLAGMVSHFPPQYNDFLLSTLWLWWIPQALDLSVALFSHSLSPTPDRLGPSSSAPPISGSPSAGSLNLLPAPPSAPPLLSLADTVTAFTRYSAFVVYMLCGGYSDTHPSFVEPLTGAAVPHALETPRSNWRKISRKSSLSRLPLSAGSPKQDALRNPLAHSEPDSSVLQHPRFSSSPAPKREPLPVLQSLHAQLTRQSLLQLKHQSHGLRSCSTSRSLSDRIISPRSETSSAFLNDPRFVPITTHQANLPPTKIRRRLRKILLQQPFLLPHYICQIELRRPSSDAIYHALLRFFDYESLILPLFESTFLAELPVAVKDHTTLFRGESSFAKLLSTLLTSNEMLDYLKNLVSPLITDLINLDLNLEVDPNKHPGGSLGAMENADKLVAITQNTLDYIRQIGASQCPSLLRLLLTIIRRRTRQRFPQMETTIIGGFFFLRFVCPAIVSPLKFHLVSSTPSVHTGRALILVSKLLQSVSNGVLLDGTKEDYLSSFPIFNEFISRNLDETVAFLQDLSVPPYNSCYHSSSPQLARSRFMSEIYLFESENLHLLSLITIENFIQQHMALLLHAIPRESSLAAALVTYQTHSDPFILRSTLTNTDAFSLNIQGFLQKLPDQLKSPIFNLSLYPQETSNSALSSSLLTFSLPQDAPMIWDRFHDRLSTLAKGFIEFLRYWPSFILPDQQLERQRHALSQLCFLHHLVKATFNSILPTFHHPDILIWDSLSNLLHEALFVAASSILTDPSAAQRAIAMAVMQLRWTSSQIFGLYFLD